jgi:hypothetical protein
MAKPGSTHVIEIETGIGEPAFIPLTMGQELQPISVGKKGMWRIESARVLDVHAFVYFDGTSLFVQSADESQAASVDGYRVGKAWTELHAPCKIEIGAARLRFRSLSDPIQEEPPPKPKPEPPRPGSRSPQPVDPELGETLPPPGDSKTRVADPQRQAPQGHQTNQVTPEPQRSIRNMTGPVMPSHLAMQQQGSMAPVQAIPASQHPPGLMNNAIMSGVHSHLPAGPHGNSQAPVPMHTAAMPGAPGMGPNMGGPIPSGSMGGFGPMNTGMTGMSMRGAPTVATRDQSSGGPGLEHLIAKFNELNTPRKLLVIMAPFCLIASAYLLLFDDDTPAPQDNTMMDAGAGPAFGQNNPNQGRCPPGFVPYTLPVNGQIPCVPLGTPMPPAPGMAPAPAPMPMPMPMPIPGVIDAGVAVAPGPAPRPGPAPAPAPDPTPVAARTLERQAVDAVAVNDYARAAAIYDQLLAQSNPKNPVYAEAARILRQKADAGAPAQ